MLNKREVMPGTSDLVNYTVLEQLWLLESIEILIS